MPKLIDSIFFDSDPATGSDNTDNGGRFHVTLDPPLHLNENKRLTCALHTCDIWYTIPNVSSVLNNDHFRFLDTTTATTYDMTFVKGLYSVSTIESAINDFLINNLLPSGIFQFDPDDSTGYISLKINRVGVTVYWSDANSIGSLLGFTTDDGPTTVSGLIYESNTQAQLNLLRNILLNFSAASSYFNGKGGSNVIGSITPNVPVGSLIAYEPYNLLDVKLIGNHHDHLSLWLTNSRTGEVVDTNGEYWSCTITFYEDDY